MSFSKNKSTLLSKLGNRCFCSFPSAMLHLQLIQVSTSMTSPYKSLYVWVKHFFGCLVYETFFWPESWRGSLYMYLLQFPRFWTLSIERFWFLFGSILNGVTLKSSNIHAIINWMNILKHETEENKNTNFDSSSTLRADVSKNRPEVE